MKSRVAQPNRAGCPWPMGAWPQEAEAGGHPGYTSNITRLICTYGMGPAGVQGCRGKRVQGAGILPLVQFGCYQTRDKAGRRPACPVVVIKPDTRLLLVMRNIFKPWSQFVNFPPKYFHFPAACFPKHPDHIVTTSGIPCKLDIDTETPCLDFFHLPR